MQLMLVALCVSLIMPAIKMKIKSKVTTQWAIVFQNCSLMAQSTNAFCRQGGILALMKNFYSIIIMIVKIQ